jgi:ribosome-associated toxin RatA of RatAB toxin-antitoxin module
VNKSDKIIIFFYIFLAFSYGSYVFTYDTGLDESLLEVVMPKKITEFETSRLVDVPNNRIFDVMTDIENFPNILPKNILYVNILTKTDSVIIAEEELSEAGIKTKLFVKHTIKPYSEHIIEIIDGDAEGTIITQYFEPVDSQTKLTTKVNLKMKGVASIVPFLPKSNLVHALNTVISHFVEYSKYDVFEIAINALYQEILDRPVDEEGLSYFSPLLRDGQITEQEIRIILFNSEERVSMQMKPIDELSNETINIINDLYGKILFRESDSEGLLYFGNLFENGTTSDEIRTILLESDEAQTLSLMNPIRSEIIVVYKTIFAKFPEKSVVDHYHKLIDDGLMTIEDIQKELEEYEE